MKYGETENRLVRRVRFGYSEREEKKHDRETGYGIIQTGRKRK